MLGFRHVIRIGPERLKRGWDADFAYGFLSIRKTRIPQ